MTNKEAIEYLKEAQSHIDLEMGGYTQEMYDAIDLAIEILEEKEFERELKKQGVHLMWMNDEHLKLLKEFEQKRGEEND